MSKLLTVTAVLMTLLGLSACQSQSPPDLPPRPSPSPSRKLVKDALNHMRIQHPLNDSDLQLLLNDVDLFLLDADTTRVALHAIALNHGAKSRDVRWDEYLHLETAAGKTIRPSLSSPSSLLVVPPSTKSIADVVFTLRTPDFPAALYATDDFTIPFPRPAYRPDPSARSVALDHSCRCGKLDVEAVRVVITSIPREDTSLAPLPSGGRWLALELLVSNPTEKILQLRWDDLIHVWSARSEKLHAGSTRVEEDVPVDSGGTFLPGGQSAHVRLIYLVRAADMPIRLEYADYESILPKLQ